MIKFLLALAAVIATLWMISAAHQSSVCNGAGFERIVWYENGQMRDRLGSASDLFPAMTYGEKFAKADIKYADYYRFEQCGGLRQYAQIVNVVRFAVGNNFEFAPSSKYSNAAQVPMAWVQEPINVIIPGDVHQAQLMYADARGGARSWLTQSNGNPGRKSLIDSFEIEWLKGESLDQAHFVGIWQGGWLFRSTKPGYYVWIN